MQKKHHEISRRFLKVELTLILHGFQNMPLSCARCECNGDVEIAIICILCEQLGFSFDVNNIFSALMFSFSAIFRMSSIQKKFSGFNRID